MLICHRLYWFAQDKFNPFLGEPPDVSAHPIASDFKPREPMGFDESGEFAVFAVL